MGIKFRCHACDKKLHVKAFLAGKRGVCPRCGAKVPIPHASQDTSRNQPGGEASRGQPAETSGDGSRDAKRTDEERGPVPAPARPDGPAPIATGGEPQKKVDPIGQVPDAVWYVRPPSGGEYGPANGAVMRRWLDEGRVSADSMVWREGWPDWSIAGSVFPEFSAEESAVATMPDLSQPTPTQERSLPIATDASPTRRRAAATRGQKNGRRNMTIITVMSVLSVILLIVLVIVLQSQG